MHRWPIYTQRECARTHQACVDVKYVWHTKKIIRFECNVIKYLYPRISEQVDVCSTYLHLESLLSAQSLHVERSKHRGWSATSTSTLGCGQSTACLDSRQSIHVADVLVLDAQVREAGPHRPVETTFFSSERLVSDLHPRAHPQFSMDHERHISAKYIQPSPLEIYDKHD